MADNTEVIIDLSNYKERQGSRVAPNDYLVVVEDAETATARTGSQMINLWLKIQGGEFDGLTLTDRLVLTEKSLFRVVGFMQAIGMPTPKGKLKLNLKQFIGKRLVVTVEDGEPYNGRVRSEIRAYARAAGVQQSATATEDDFASINSSFDTTSTSSEVADLPEASSTETPSATSAAGSLPAPETQPGTEAAATADVSVADKEPSPAQKKDETPAAAAGEASDINLDEFDL